MLFKSIIKCPIVIDCVSIYKVINAHTPQANQHKIPWNKYSELTTACIVPHLALATSSRLSGAIGKAIFPETTGFMDNQAYCTSRHTKKMCYCSVFTTCSQTPQSNSYTFLQAFLILVSSCSIAELTSLHKYKNVALLIFSTQSLFWWKTAHDNMTLPLLGLV